MSHTKLRYALLIENHLKHLKHEYGRLLSAPPPSGLLFCRVQVCKNGGSEGPPLHSVEMALTALLSCIIPLHFGLLTVGLGRRHFISGKRRGGEGNRNTQRNDHRNEALHGCFSVYLSQAGNRRTTLP